MKLFTWSNLALSFVGSGNPDGKSNLNVRQKLVKLTITKDQVFNVKYNSKIFVWYNSAYYFADIQNVQATEKQSSKLRIIYQESFVNANN